MYICYLFYFLAPLPIQKPSNARSNLIVLNQISFNEVKSFAEESTATKINIILKWIFPDSPNECKDIKDGKKIQNKYGAVRKLNELG